MNKSVKTSARGIDNIGACGERSPRLAQVRDYVGKESLRVLDSLVE